MSSRILRHGSREERTMITITLQSFDTTPDLFLSLLDLNLGANQLILDRQRLNTGDSLSVSVQEDGDGHGKVTWLANPTNEPLTVRQETVTVNDGDLVRVSN